jgi:hypothetical protein
MEKIRFGAINLMSYLSNRSYNRIKANFYLYDKLYTTTYVDFKQEMEYGYGHASHLDKISLLVEQELIEEIPGESFTNIQINDEALENDSQTTYQRYLTALEDLQAKGKTINELSDRLKIDPTESKILEIAALREHMGKTADQVTFNSFDVMAMNERLDALRIGANINQKVSPVTSINAYNDIPTIVNKSEIYCVLLNKMPIPDDSVPLADIIQYRNDEANALNFLKLQTWVNKMSHSRYSLDEINDEIDYLMAEYRDAMRRAGIKMKNARLEFVVKLIPELLENIVKLNFSKIPDPLFKVRAEKRALLESERNAKGNELAYILTDG